MGWAIATSFGFEPEIAAGIILIGSCSGGVASNVMTFLARGNVALSVTMTAISSVAAVATVPFFLGLAASHFDAGEIGDIEMEGVVARVFLVTVLPISLGMAVRWRWPRWTEAAYDDFKRLALVLFALVVVGAVIAEHATVFAHAAEIGAAALTLNLAAMGISFAVSKLARLDDRQATAISLELGIHNALLAIAVGASVATVLTIPAAVYSAFMFVTGITFAHLMYQRNAGAGEPAIAPSAARD